MKMTRPTLLQSLSFPQPRDRGFTLIELLVVIAIIGILAAVVLASLNAARDNSKDGAIKEQMGEMRAQAELYFASNGTYGVNFAQDGVTSCNGAGTGANTIFTSATGGIGGMVTAIGTKITGAPAGTRVYCAVSATQASWAFAAPLLKPVATSTGWCVDSSGSAKAVSIGFTLAGTPLGGGAAVARCP